MATPKDGREGAKERDEASEGAEDEVLEPLEPDGELGETREVGPRSSSARLPGKPPLTRVEVHEPGEQPGDP